MKTSKFLIVCFTLVVACSSTFGALAEVPYKSYIYSTSTGKVTAEYSPIPYVPVQTIDKSSLGVSLVQPTCMCFDAQQNLYITDTDQNKLLILDKNYNLIKKVEDFENNGLFDFFGAPEGVFVDKNGDIYVCDTGQKRIIVLDKDCRFKKEIKDVKPTNADENYIFLPSRITVDSSGNIYVISKNEYAGIFQLDSNGKFISFIGGNKVVFNPIIKLWKKIMTKEQNVQMEKFLPVEYTNMQMNDEGFIYTASKSENSKNPIKKLNLSGKDILIQNGYVNVVGDICTSDSEKKSFKASSFTDVCPDLNGLVYALDATQGRIFVYNDEGFLYYVFGGLGQQIGNFVTPTAIEVKGSDVLVSDSANGRITVFKRTEYGDLIDKANHAYSIGEYDQSVETWQKVIQLNSNFELAYAQIGKVYLRQNRCEDAMKYFVLGNYRGDKVTGTSGYNKAFFEYRRDKASDYLGPTVLVIIALIVIRFVFKRYRKRRSTNERKS